MKSPRSPVFENSRTEGFTLTELLVIVGTIAILGLLLLPAIAGTKPNSQAFQCLENQRQLTLGWQMYAEDNNGKLTLNLEWNQQYLGPTDPNILPGGKYFQWCPGSMSSYSTGSTNFIQAGAIFPYVKTVSTYKCPADKAAFFNNPIYPKPRSYSLNCWLNPYPGSDATAIFGGSQARIFTKNTDLSRPGPAKTFVLIEENVNSIDDGYFAGTPGLPGKWINVPSTRHAGASSLSFADGHVMIRGWKDKMVVAANDPGWTAPGSTFLSDANSADNAWLQERESYVLP